MTRTAWTASMTFVLALGVAPTASADKKSKETALAKVARKMKPGSWQVLETDGLTPELRKSVRGLDIMGWTDDAHWDSKSGQLFYMGLRIERRFIAYSADKNAWRRIELPADHEPAGSPRVGSRFGHIYSNNACDPDKGRFYHLYHGAGPDAGPERAGGISYFDTATEKWTRLPPTDKYTMTGGIEYFSARKGLLVLRVGGQLRFFDDEKRAWAELPDSPVHGHHSMLRHNPYRQEVLMLGGNNTPRVVARLTKEGKIERLKDAPVDLGIRHDKLTVDPVTGNYLILAWEEKKLYEFDSRANEFTLLDDFQKTAWPFHKYEMPVGAYVPEHGVVVFVGRQMHVYKPRAAKK